MTKSEVEKVLEELDVTAPIHLLEVTSNEDAERLRFVGSPSVRIDGNDVDPTAATDGFGLECRVYWVDGKVTSTPPRELIALAVAGAASRS